MTDKTDPNGGKLYFLRRLPADPMCESCEGTDAADTWETRSYDSSAESFSSGRDVFDLRAPQRKKRNQWHPVQRMVGAPAPVSR